MDTKRRELLRNLALAPLLVSAGNLNAKPYQGKATPNTRLQYSVNAYSFNSQLRSGEMTFFDMMDFAANIGLDAVDLTGYYFSTYPETPPNEELYQLKLKALELGLNISWTGVRNDFVNPDPESRKADREMIKRWLATSSKLGAYLMRVFAGTSKHEGYSRDQARDWLVEEFTTCAQYAEEMGVLLALQNHHDFLYQSDEIIDVLKRVDSKWFGLILDIGSLRKGDTYDEIRKLAPYANYWFIKEYVYPNGEKEEVNMRKIAEILKSENYQGYISFENLSPENPKRTVTRMANSFRNEYDKL